MIVDNNPKKQCFTSIQSRKLLGGMETCQLCPSMDLIVFGSSLSQQSLYRTVSWQKVATINQDTISSSLKKDEPSKADPTTKTTTCWSPDGRWIVVANDTKISLYGVEPLANPLGGASFNNNGPTEAQLSWDVKSPVIGLSWVHVGRHHPTAWKPSTDEVEDEVYWSYQSQYVDKASDFLPPSSYHHNVAEDDDHQYHQEATTTTALPECKTPLSILCVSTTSHMSFYLHGRYLLFEVPRPEDEMPLSSPQVVASNDLTHFIVYSEPRVFFYHLPFLKNDRYPLQTIASLYSSTLSHLSMLQKSIPEVLNAWKSSLKPLDTKLQPLQRLLQNYGVDDQPLGSVLKQYILVGHTSDSSSVANAMDQFFTSVQMNDQLLQRMIRTLHGSLANVESQARKSLQSPTQALCFQIQELSGFIQFHRNHEDNQSTKALQELVDASQYLWVSVEALLKYIVESRFKVRAFCGYLRHAGSQIKAKGTASKSVQRENAKKRRVSQAVLEQLLSFLNTKPRMDKQGSLTEHLLSIHVLDILKDIPRQPKEDRPSSPSSVVGFSESDMPRVGFAAKQTLEASKKVFMNPLSNVPQSIVPKDLKLPQFQDSNPSHVVIHTRIGREPAIEHEGWEQEVDDDDDGEEDRTFFLPRVSKQSLIDLPDYFDCRQWSVIVQAHGNIIQLYCIPLGWKYPKTSQGDGSIYLTAKLVLPSGLVVNDLGIYSDDGKSSLSSGNDSGTGKEGRQKLGILVEDKGQLVLWLVAYENLSWQVVPFESTFIDPTQVDDDCSFNVMAYPEGYDDEDEDQLDIDDSILMAQTRIISESFSRDESSRLWLCGSRGVGGVALTSQGITSLELLDLEEDDYEEDEDEDFEEE